MNSTKIAKLLKTYDTPDKEGDIMSNFVYFLGQSNHIRVPAERDEFYTGFRAEYRVLKRYRLSLDTEDDDWDPKPETWVKTDDDIYCFGFMDRFEYYPSYWCLSHDQRNSGLIFTKNVIKDALKIVLEHPIKNADHLNAVLNMKGKFIKGGVMMKHILKKVKSYMSFDPYYEFGFPIDHPFRIEYMKNKEYQDLPFYGEFPNIKLGWNYGDRIYKRNIKYTYKRAQLIVRHGKFAARLEAVESPILNLKEDN